ncbi:homocysteine S-methyltransferase family protein [Caldimonas tepidiphila]|uniref:homocysteine S-methyltransferase family protein n=1 Tax=Caldimonas tepidiphila TaxID=2315841 RepID=UPI000E5B8EBB|nr:homocysteine S-methyltransferase family protein [Caldimonas tepidiphila]
MAKYRGQLPQLGDGLFATDGGLETTLIFDEGIELPSFAAFVLLDSDEGRAVLRKYFRSYGAIAARHGMGIVLESPTWRANRDWGARLGHSRESLDRLNREAIGLLVELRGEMEAGGKEPVVISGNIGPRGDGYSVSVRMSSAEAESYHRQQIETFAQTEADMVAAFTLNHVDEATGIARAARAFGMPVALSFTVETDGRLPDGQTLREAIEATDDATTGSAAYYMVNCAHPTHLEDALAEGGEWLSRLRGVRANASRKSHKELDEASALDAGDPRELGSQYADLQRMLPFLSVVGGCCGTDQRHVDAICKALTRG